MIFMKTRHLEQEKLLEKLTNFIQMYWDETLDLEMSDIIDQCSKSDTDFEFVIDQSGSGKGLYQRVSSVRRSRAGHQQGKNAIKDH